MLVLALAAAALAGAVIENSVIKDTIADLPDLGPTSGGGVELAVDPTGRVVACKSILTVGGPEVADAMCARLKGVKLKPATDSDGRSAQGLVRVFAQRVPSGSQNEAWSIGLRPEIEIALASRPAGLPESGVVIVHAAVGTEGRVSECRVADVRFKSFETPACGGLRTVDFTDLRGADASAPFVTTTAVRFIPAG